MRMGACSGKLFPTGVSILVNIGGLGNVTQGKASNESQSDTRASKPKIGI